MAGIAKLPDCWAQNLVLSSVSLGSSLHRQITLEFKNHKKCVRPFKENSVMTRCALYFLAFVGCAVASIHYDAAAFPTVPSGQIAPKEYGFSHAVKSKKCKEDQEKNGSPCCADDPPPYCR
jgi:hypothetical protein